MTDEITEEQIQNVHPFAMWVIDQLEIRKGTADAVFLDEDILELAKGLEMLLDSEELRFAVVSLLNLAATLQESGSPKTAKMIYELMERPKILDALRALNSERETETEEQKVERQKAFDKLSGRGEKSQPAKVGEERPKDTVTLDGLKFPRRL